MKFYVTFRGVLEKGLFSIQSGAPEGLAILDQVRAEYGPHILAKNVEAEFCSAFNPEILIEEQMARESGHFGHTACIEVTVPRHALPRKVKMRKREISENICVYFTADTDKILKEWKRAGFPLKWENPEFD